MLIVTLFIYEWKINPNEVITDAEKNNIISKRGNDVCIELSKNEALQNIDEFNSSLSNNTEGLSYSIKSVFEGGKLPEHMWVLVTSYENGSYKGTLANDPIYVTNLKINDEVIIKSNEIEDWIISKGDTMIRGGFSLKCFK